MTAQIRAALERRPADRIGVSAHRGASLERPENTLAAFRLGIDHGAEGIELDVALSADGVAVVMHDGTVDRTTDGTGEVASLTLDELRRLDAGGGERIPTLAEVLELAGATVEVNIELKAPDAAPAVAQVVSEFPDLRWFASSGQWDALAELRTLVPEARIFPLTIGVATLDDMRALAIAGGYPPAAIDAELARFSALGRRLEEAMEFAARVSATGVSIWERGLAAADVDRIHAAGLEAWVWTVNDPARAVELFGYGIDALCTDDPAAMIAARAGAAR